MTIKGKGTNYLYVNSDGIYIIQLHIPVYMRHLWNGRKMLKNQQVLAILCWLVGFVIST